MSTDAHPPTPSAPATTSAAPAPGTPQFADHHALPSLIFLGFVGGLLMGVANIVPGISGGAMLLLMGVYAAFLTGLADITSLRWRFRAFVAVGCVGVGALISIFLLAGPVKDLLFHYRWQSYSVLIGMRLGIIPAVWKLAGGRAAASRSLWIGAALGILLTGVAAIFKYRPDLLGAAPTSSPMLFLGGLLAASATILPGLDGSYLLLLLGQYVPVLAAIDRLKDALTAGDLSAATSPFLTLLPFGLGAAIGIGGVAVLLRFLFQRFPRPTFGLLLGVLCGAFIGLYPFATYRAPSVGDTLRGVPIASAEQAAAIKPEDWPLAFFSPTATQTAAALGFIALGVFLAWLLSRLDPENRQEQRLG